MRRRPLAALVAASLAAPLIGLDSGCSCEDVDCGPGLVVDVPQLRSQGGNVAVTACIAQRCQTERFIGVNGKLGDAPVYVPLPDDDVARVTLVVHDSAGRMLYRAAGTLPITEYDADACVHCRHIRARGDGNALVTRPE